MVSKLTKNEQRYPHSVTLYFSVKGLAEEVATLCGMAMTKTDWPDGGSLLWAISKAKAIKLSLRGAG